MGTVTALFLLPLLSGAFYKKHSQELPVHILLSDISMLYHAEVVRHDEWADESQAHKKKWMFSEAYPDYKAFSVELK